MIVHRVTAVLAGLLMTLGGLVGLSLVASSPAQAFSECSVTRTGPPADITKGKGESTLDLKAVSTASGIMSIAVTIDVVYPTHKDISITLDGPAASTDLWTGNGFLQLGGGDANFTRTRFSDASTKPIADAASPRTGTFKPSGALDDFEGTKAAGSWSLRVRKTATFAGSKSGTIKSWTLTVKYDCDTDGDDVRDDRDNCPAAANPKQEDNDRDGRGDVCDSDPDNDGVAQKVDNCPVHNNPSQADLDRDGTGDACDEDADNDGYEYGDRCPLGASWSETGCPMVKRTSTISYAKRKALVTGRLKAPRRPVCAKGQTFFLYRVTAKGPDRRAGRIRSDARGAWKTRRGPKARAAGRYYVTGKDAFTPRFQCRTFRSKAVRLPRR